MNSPAPTLSGLARRLVTDGLLDQDLARSALSNASTHSAPLVLHLVQHAILDARTIARVASEEFGTPLFDLDALNKEVIPTNLIDQKLIKKHHTLPLTRRGNRLFVAVADPTDLHAIDEIKFNTGINTEPVLVEADKLTAAIEKFLNSQEESIGDTLGGLDEDGLDDLDIQAVEEQTKDDGGASEADEAPIVRFINKVLLDAIKSGAS